MGGMGMPRPVRAGAPQLVGDRRMVGRNDIPPEHEWRDARAAASKHVVLVDQQAKQRTQRAAPTRPYAQVGNDSLILAGCVKADTRTNTAEDLHDDSKTNDHPATAVDRGR
jgi:hypothetical protein